MSTLFQAPSLDASRSRTLTTTFVSLGVYGGIAAFVAFAGVAVQSEAVQQKLDVVFRAAPPEPAPAQHAPPPPSTPKRSKPLTAVVPTTPTVVPEAPPTESEPAPAPTNPAPAAPVQQDAPPPPPPKAKDPINLPENATPPVADAGNAAPEFPASALSMGAGSEALVILKIVVDENGNVASVKVMKGDEPFVSAATNAVKGWHYSPALVDGQRASVFRIVKIPFRLRG